MKPIASVPGDGQEGDLPLCPEGVTRKDIRLTECWCQLALRPHLGSIHLFSTPGC